MNKQAIIILHEIYGINNFIQKNIACLCCENVLCDGIVACYGSRTRAYTSLSPVCPTCLLFAEEESFDVNFLIRELHDKKHVEINRFAAKHGFIDPFSEYYNPHESKRAEKLIFNVLEKFAQ